MVSFPDQCQRVDDDVGTEIRARRIGSPRQGASPELREGVSATIGKLDVVAGLAAAAVADDQIGFQAASQEIDRGAFALVAKTKSDADDGTFHDCSSSRLATLR